MRSIRRTVNLVGGIAILGALLYVFGGFFTAPSRLRSVCAQIHPGTTLTQLQVLADAHGLNTLHEVAPVLFLVEARTFGRYGCRVEFRGPVVSKAEYEVRD
jgi:hypothetical protein